MATKNIIFDFGGVILDWDPHHLYDPYFGSREKADWFLENICTYEWNTQMDGGLPIREGVAQLLAKFPEWTKEINMYFGEWTRMVSGEIPGMRENLQEIKRLGYRIFGLTNWSAETFWRVRDKYPIFGLMEGMVVSGEEVCLKPDPKIYRILLDRFGLDPAECLFFDDNEANVRGAEAVGIPAVRFISSGWLRDYIKENLPALK